MKDHIRTYWNGEICIGLRGTVIVGKSPLPTWWCAKLEGQRVMCVRVSYGNSTFYLANDDGQGWAKITDGRGSPVYGHRTVPVDDPSTFIVDPHDSGAVGRGCGDG